MTMSFKMLIAEAAKDKVDLKLLEVKDGDTSDAPLTATFGPADGGRGRVFTAEIDNYKINVLNHSHFDKGGKAADGSEAKNIIMKKPQQVGKTEAPLIMPHPPKKKAAAKKPAAKKTTAKGKNK